MRIAYNNHNKRADAINKSIVQISKSDADSATNITNILIFCWVVLEAINPNRSDKLIVYICMVLAALAAWGRK
jgi:hypothetical protein